VVLCMLQGWTTPYDFSVADLRAAADVVAAAAASTGPNGPSWQQLLGLLQVIYGGRVSSRHDMKVLVSHLLDTFNAQLLTALPSRLQQQQQQQQYKLLRPGFGMSAGLPTSQALPTSGAKQDWLAFITALPDADQPCVLGLPANIERSIALGCGKRLLASLRDISTLQVRTAWGPGWLLTQPSLLDNETSADHSYCLVVVRVAAKALTHSDGPHRDQLVSKLRSL